MNDYKFDIVIGNIKLSFDYPIASSLRIGNKFVVQMLTTDKIKNILYNVSTDKLGNILCFDEKGNLLWEIEECERYLPMHPVRPYSSMYMSDKKDELIAYNQNGLEYIVNLEDGKIKLVPGQRAW